MFSVVLLAALAAAPADAELERFKGYFSKGEQLFGQGDYGAAIWNFRQADSVRRTPEVAFDLGKCHEKLGDKAYATFYYRLYMRRAPKAPDVLDVAERVGEALAEAEADGRGLLEVEAAAAGRATLNGTAYAEFPIAVFLPPGDYELTASFAGTLKKRVVSMHTGKITSLEFEPVQPPLLTSSPPEPPADFAPNARLAAEAKATGHPGWRTPAYAVLGVSAAALVAGSVLGAMASADESRIAGERANLTVGDARALAVSSSMKGGAANILWVAGGAGAAAGGVLLVLSLPEPGVKR